MRLQVARQISPLRRVSLPKVLMKSGDMAEECSVVVEADGGDRILLREAEADVPKREGAWLRRVAVTRQVTIPADLMRELGLKINDWVYLMPAPHKKALHLVPAGVGGDGS